MLAFECLLMNSANGNVYAVEFGVMNSHYSNKKIDHDALHKQLPLLQDMIGVIP